MSSAALTFFIRNLVMETFLMLLVFGLAADRQSSALTDSLNAVIDQLPFFVGPRVGQLDFEDLIVIEGGTLFQLIKIVIQGCHRRRHLPLRSCQERQFLR